MHLDLHRLNYDIHLQANEFKNLLQKINIYVIILHDLPALELCYWHSYMFKFNANSNNIFLDLKSVFLFLTKIVNMKSLGEIWPVKLCIVGQFLKWVRPAYIANYLQMHPLANQLLWTSYSYKTYLTFFVQLLYSSLLGQHYNIKTKIRKLKL